MRPILTSSTVAAIAVALGLAVLAQVGCRKPIAQGQNAARAKPPEVVLVGSPTITEVTDYEDFTGRTMAIATIDIRPRVTGYLEKVYFTEGAEVKQGDLLFEIDARTYQAEVARAESSLSQAEARLKRLNAELQRAAGLVNTRIVTREDYDRIVGDHAEADAAVGVAQASLDFAKQMLDYTKVRAPIGGKLSRSMLDPGNLARADETILTTIVAMDPIYAYFGVDERLLTRVRSYVEKGLLKRNEEGLVPIMMGLANEEGFPHPGAVNFVDNRLDTNTGTLQVRGVFPNPKHSILPGLFARIRLPLGDAYQALLIPEQALGVDQGQRFVYVVGGDNKVQYRGVQVGKQQGTQRVVLGGISATDQVVISGLQRVRSGAVVDPQPFHTPVSTARRGNDVPAPVSDAPAPVSAGSTQPTSNGSGE